MTRSPASQSIGRTKLQRLLVWTACVFLLSVGCLVALIKTDILPPIEVMAYQFGYTKAPTLGNFSVDIRGWGWYPILANEKTAKRPASITFVRFSPHRDPTTHHVTIFHRSDKLLDETMLVEKVFAWGTAMLVKPVLAPKIETRFAWLPAQQYFVAATSEDDLLDALSILEIRKND